MRVVAWNIRAGGGSRIAGIARQVRRWRPDVLAFSEFRGTPASCELAAMIARDANLIHQRATTNASHLPMNALLVASRWPLRVVRHACRPDNPQRWLHVNVAAPVPFAVIAIHVPNRVTGQKYPFLDAVSRVAARWRGDLPALIVGDTNSGRIDIDEESPAFNQIEDQWMQSMARQGWPDGFRHLRPRQRQYTWYSPNGRNGFRLDQAFVNPPMLAQLKNIRHVWAGATRQRREVLSDHASLLVDFDWPEQDA